MLPDTGSLKLCECTACGQLFTSAGNFDRHQAGNDPVRCYPPTAKGLVIVRRAADGRPIWGREGTVPTARRESQRISKVGV